MDACQRALEVYTREDVPFMWAQVQKDMGLALLEEATSSKRPKLPAIASTKA